MASRIPYPSFIKKANRSGFSSAFYRGLKYCFEISRTFETTDAFYVGRDVDTVETEHGSRQIGAVATPEIFSPSWPAPQRQIIAKLQIKVWWC